ncbi:MAG: nucleotidyltransferase family protein [Patescibacteria group bacterium]|nr:nucleotidyltransferase family protein [Patescibacteria group bacterium]
MQLVILAAGRGIRMMPVTKKIPKPMVLLKGKPKLEYTLRSLPEEINEIIIVVNYLSEQIKDYFGDLFDGKRIIYVKQRQLNGTGGALHFCKDYLDNRFMVMMGDDLYHKNDIKQMAKHDLALLAKEVNNASRFGRVLVDKNNYFCGIIENKNVDQNTKCNGPNLINTALYVLNKRFFDYSLVPISDTEYGLPQTLTIMANEHKIKVEKATLWIPLGGAGDIAIAEKYLDSF